MRSRGACPLQRNCLTGLLLCFCLTTLLDGSLSSQQSPAATEPSTSPAQAQPGASPDAEPAQSSGQTKDDASQTGDSTKATSNDRLFFALPNFLTLENSANVPPLTVGQKFKVVARSSFDPVQFVWYGFLAGISQAQDSEPGYGQGAEGYAKRYGAAFADGTIENFMTSAVMASLFRQDPRFYQLSEGGFVHRATYAVSRIVITRSDSGHRQFNFSEILGSATAATISTYSYHPREDRNIGNTASVWGSMIGYDTLTIVVKEFWPDIRRKLQKK
jgi:hypothetical protein